MSRNHVLQNTDTPADPDRIRATLERYGVKVPAKGTPKKLAEMLRVAYKNRIEESGLEEDDWIQCHECLEITDDDEDLEACPFCGDDGLDDDEANVREAEEAEPQEAEGEAQDAENAKRAAKLAKTGAHTLEVVRDAATVAREIRKLDTAIVTSAYKIGLLLKEVHEAMSWKKEGFKSFTDWWRNELKYSKKFVQNMMRAVEVFSAKDFEDVGHSKLQLIANVPDPDRERLLKEAREGATKRELESASKKVRGVKPGSRQITLIGKVGGKPKTHRFVDAQGETLKKWEKDAYAAVQISDDVFFYIALKTNKAGEVVGVSTQFQRVEEPEQSVN